jgi:methylphosphotriester-DNA--protein-cysteine methyltransferase
MAPALPSVETDNEAIARLAAEHLLERGLKHFGYCGVAGIRTSMVRGEHFARRLVGRTPHAEIVHARLRHVEELLTETDLPLKSIASRKGFPHVQYLISSFKKNLGLTPGEYRLQNQPAPPRT